MNLRQTLPIVLCLLNLAVCGQKKPPALQSVNNALERHLKERDWASFLTDLEKLEQVIYSEEVDKELFYGWIKRALSVIDNNELEFRAQLHQAAGHYLDDNLLHIDSALNHFRQAEAIMIQAKGEINNVVASCQISQGDLFKYRYYEFNKAEKYYEKALDVLEKVPDVDSILLTKVYYNLATTNRSQRDYDKALAYGLSCMQLSEQINHPVFKERIYNILANIYRDMGQTHEAKEYYNKAATLNVRVNHNKSDLAWHYGGLAETFKRDSVYNDAIVYFKKAIDLFEGLALQNQLVGDDLMLYMDDQVKYAEALRLVGRQADALYWYNKHFKTLKKFDLFFGRSRFDAYVELGDFYRHNHMFDSAMRQYDRALASISPTFLKNDIRQLLKEDKLSSHAYAHRVFSGKGAVLKALAKGQESSKNLVNALMHFEVAENLISSEYSDLDSESSKWSYLNNNFDIYEEILEVLYALRGKTDADTLMSKIFYFLERSKSRSLSEALNSKETAQTLSESDSLLRTHARMRSDMLAYQDKLQQLEDGTPEALVLRQRMVDTDRKIQAFEKTFEEEYPGYFTIRKRLATKTLDDVRAFLAPDACVIEYFWGNRNVYALIVTKAQSTFRLLGSVDKIGDQIRIMTAHFDFSKSNADINRFKSFTASAHRLYTSLLAPLISAESIDRIYVIPDGAVSLVPFDLLLTEPVSSMVIDYKHLPYVIKRYYTGYSYSAFTLIRNSAGNIASPALLGMAFTGGKRTRAYDEDLEEIVGSERELETLQKRFGNGNYLLGPEVTEYNFKRLAPAYDIIHLAIHGKGNPLLPFSASLFFRTKNDSIDDGRLHAYELFAMKLKAKLAVLSSCESGLGKSYKGDGMMSMASAFTYTGCENVLMSLWEVHDQISVDLMDSFYEALSEGRDIGEALRMAKLNYLENADEMTADPKLWGALAAYGNLKPLHTKSNSRTILFIVIGIFVLLCCIWIIRRVI